MENLDKQIRKNALNAGLILGLIIFALGILSFYYVTGMATSFFMIFLVPIVISIILPIIIIVFFCISARKKIGGFWTFKQAVTGIFIMLLTAYAVESIGRDLIFSKLVEPNMVQKTSDAMIKATTAMMEKSGADQTTIDQKTADMQKTFDEQKNVSIGKVIEGIGIAIILIFVLSLIFAAIFKKEPLKFDPEPTQPVG